MSNQVEQMKEAITQQEQQLLSVTAQMYELGEQRKSIIGNLTVLRQTVGLFDEPEDTSSD